ncbi:MAG: flagellar basal-body MS-ring/collar protein FliF [Maritimibacter sp.]
MQQILAVWNSLDMRRRAIVVAATIAMFAAILALARIASQPSMELLYAGLEPGPAGEVLQALEAQGVANEIRGGAIYVDATKRDELRMTLASQGLPSNATQGYELLDSMSGFGTTAQMFDAAYWRAKEGELARTIVSSPLISAARVHIAVPSSQGFAARGTPSASVTVTTTSESMSAQHAKALKHLVAAAVPNLTAEAVSVIDTRGGLIMAGESIDAGGTDAATRAEDLKRNVQRLIEARVGYGNAVVELSVDTATESERITERTLNPDSRVAISTDTTETSATAQDAAASGVTVASNLPTGDTGAAGGSSSSNNAETRERVNYDVSQVTREVNRGPGTVRRITVAVLVDGIRSTDANGEEVWTPRSDEELDALKELVASTVGFDESRGDTITIKSMEFQPLAPVGSAAPTGLFASLNIDVMSIIRLAVLAIVALVLGLFVLRPIFGSQRALPAPAGALPGPDSGPDLGGADLADISGFGDLPALNGEIDDGGLGGPEMAVVSDFSFGNDLPALQDPNDPVNRLRNLIEKRQDETVEILRGWMEDEEETA